MKRILLFILALCLYGISTAQNITAIEYFFDADPGSGNGSAVSITAATTINTTFDVSISSLSDGFHTLSIRAKDANNKWSTTFTSPIYKISATTFAAAPNITKLEYFIDGDLGAGVGTNVPITSGTSIDNLQVAVPLTSVAEGFHTVTFRARDANGKWSTAFTSPFYKLAAASLEAAPNLTKLEYFIDGDLGAGSGTDVPFTAGTSISNLQVTIPLTSLADGFHTLTFRAKDANGKWSTAYTNPFYKLPATSLAAAPNITKLEYFIDNIDPGYGLATDVPVTASTSISSLLIDIPVSSLSTGTHTINLRAMDASGNWSMVYSANFGVFGPAPVAQPTNIIFSPPTTTSYTVSFTAPTTAPAGYIAIRKVGSAPTLDPVDGVTYTVGSTHGDGKIAYVGTAITFNETALLSGTQYFYKIYAYNGSGTLTNYLTSPPLQGNTTTLVDPVKITVQPPSSGSFTKGSSMTVSITVNDASKANGVVLKYKGISASTWTSTTVTNSGNKFEKVIAASDLTDLIGIKYYFEVTDKNQSSTIVSSNTGKAYVSYQSSSSDQVIPSLSFGDKQSNYQIISIPLVLSNKNPSDVFSALGSYDQTLWRLFDYFNNDNREYPGFSSIEPGKGYWLISRFNTTINPGAGTAVQVDETTPFTITLVPGWNLIGNPYNFRISWTEVLTASGNPTGVTSSITTFNNGTLSDAIVLDRYRGAFIQNTTTTSIELKVPVLRNTTLGGGRISQEEIDLLKNQWTIPISVSNGELTNETGGIGMHPKAQLNGQDDFDRTAVPLVEGLEMPELVFSSSNSKTALTKEVVPSQDHFTWQFEANQTGDKVLKLEWPVIEKKGDQQLVLLDLASQRLIDMTNVNEVTLSPGSKSLRIIFGDQNYITRGLEKELPSLGQPYPNPAHAEVNIPFFISESLDNSNVTIRVYNTLGKEVATLMDNHSNKGYHIVNWKPTEPPGVYVVTMKVGSGDAKWTKLIIQ